MRSNILRARAIGRFLLHRARRVYSLVEYERPWTLPAILGQRGRETGLADDFAKECGKRRKFVRREFWSKHRGEAVKA